MPLIRVELTEGRSAAQRRRFAQSLAQAAVEHLGATSDKVRVRFIEMAADEMLRGPDVLDTATGPSDTTT